MEANMRLLLHMCLLMTITGRVHTIKCWDFDVLSPERNVTVTVTSSTCGLLSDVTFIQQCPGKKNVIPTTEVSKGVYQYGCPSQMHMVAVTHDLYSTENLLVLEGTSDVDNTIVIECKRRSVCPVFSYEFHIGIGNSCPQPISTPTVLDAFGSPVPYDTSYQYNFQSCAASSQVTVLYEEQQLPFVINETDKVLIVECDEPACRRYKVNVKLNETCVIPWDTVNLIAEGAENTTKKRPGVFVVWYCTTEPNVTILYDGCEWSTTLLQSKEILYIDCDEPEEEEPVCTRYKVKVKLRGECEAPRKSINVRADDAESVTKKHPGVFVVWYCFPNPSITVLYADREFPLKLELSKEIFYINCDSF